MSKWAVFKGLLFYFFMVYLTTLRVAETAYRVMM